MGSDEQSREQQSSNFLSDLINGGFVDTALSPFDERVSSIKYFDWFRKIKYIKRDWGDQETYELWQAPQSQRWQESHLTPQIHSPSTVWWAIELARFAVPEGQIGFLRRIEQVVNDDQGSYFPTNVAYWGSPQFVFPDVDNLRWYFTLSYFNGTLPPRYNLFSAVPIPAHALPGAPYTDLPEIDGLWYPAHGSHDFKLIVPGGRILRFFMLTPPCVEYTWQVSGKLSGYTQSTYQLASLRNAREIY